VFHGSRAWRRRYNTFNIVPAPGGSERIRFPWSPAPGGSETLRFPLFPRLAAQKPYVFYLSRGWRLRNITLSTVPALGGSETINVP